MSCHKSPKAQPEARNGFRYRAWTHSEKSKCIWVLECTIFYANRLTCTCELKDKTKKFESKSLGTMLSCTYIMLSHSLTAYNSLGSFLEPSSISSWPRDSCLNRTLRTIWETWLFPKLCQKFQPYMGPHFLSSTEGTSKTSNLHLHSSTLSSTTVVQ